MSPTCCADCSHMQWWCYAPTCTRNPLRNAQQVDLKDFEELGLRPKCSRRRKLYEKFLGTLVPYIIAPPGLQWLCPLNAVKFLQRLCVEREEARHQEKWRGQDSFSKHHCLWQVQLTENWSQENITKLANEGHEQTQSALNMLYM